VHAFSRTRRPEANALRHRADVHFGHRSKVCADAADAAAALPHARARTMEQAE